ncbi:MAG: elongation factor G [Candidatus Latescibacterota bacterium]|nr:MAG: elongation factor G [Candidatus Latescibacterota bacterium]
MREYTPDVIRNIGLVGHGSCGKTSLAEAMLFCAGEINRMGKVEEGNTRSDYTQDERERQISLNSTVLHAHWNGVKVNIVDTPGYPDFVGEVKAALRALDNAVVVLSAVDGIGVGTERAWEFVEEYGLPVFFFVSQMGREYADFDKVLQSIQERFGSGVVPIQFPVDGGTGFHRIVDILKMKLLTYTPGAQDRPKEEPIPAELEGRAAEMREQLVEAVAEVSEELMERYFEEGGLEEEELKKGIKQGIKERALFPALCGDGTSNVGVDRLLDIVADYGVAPMDVEEVIGTRPGSGEEVRLPARPDAPLSLLVFKTISEPHVGELSFFRVYSGTLKSGAEVLNSTKGIVERIGQIYSMNGNERHEVGTMTTGDIGALVKLRDTHTGDTLCDRNNPVLLPGIQFPEPVIQIAVSPRAKGDEEKINSGLARLHEEDPTFTFRVDPELKQTILEGMGEMHLEVVISKLKRKFGVEVDVEEPRIPYRETILAQAEGHHRHKKQTGGRGQYGEVYLRIEPLERGAGFEFVDAITGGVIPSKFIPSVEKGIRETMAEGVLAGYPVVDLKATVYDGSFHPVDSNDISFKIAASMAFKDAFMKAKPILLEPIYEVEVIVPEEYMGDVMGDLSGRRGKILGMEARGPFQVVKALVPLKELYRYSTTLRSITQGRGMHTQRFSHYEQVPQEIAEKIIQEAKAAKEK